VHRQMEKAFSHSDVHCPGYDRIVGIGQALT